MRFFSEPGLLQIRQVVKNVSLIVRLASTFAASMFIVAKMTNVARGRHETQIRIILRADIGATWHPGDVIDGHVQLTSAVQLTPMGTRVFFEGTSDCISKNIDAVLLIGEQGPLGLGAPWIIPIRPIQTKQL